MLKRRGIGKGPTVIARSYLFVPGDRNDMLAKAERRGADALIIDLEDAVAPTQKDAARLTAGAWIIDPARVSIETWVRINPGTAQADVTAVFASGLTGVVVPKVNAVDDVGALDGLLSELESDAGRPLGSVRVLPIIETARGMLAVTAIARTRRVAQLMIGELDLGADLGADPTEPDAFGPLRMQVVVASAAAEIAPPLGPVSPDYRDLDAFRAETMLLARQGFGSRPAIHPAQIPVINDAFTPDEGDVERARSVVDRYERALAAGIGAVTDADGAMVDEAVVKVARRVLERARWAESV